MEEAEESPTSQRKIGGRSLGITQVAATQEVYAGRADEGHGSPVVKDCFCPAAPRVGFKQGGSPRS